MAIVYEWRKYEEGNTPGPWVPTTTLNDLAIGDNTTNASGFTSPVLSDNDVYPNVGGNPFVWIFEARIRDDGGLAFAVDHVTFRYSLSNRTSPEFDKHFQVFVLKTGFSDLLVYDSIVSTSSNVDVDIANDYYNEIKFHMRWEHLPFGIELLNTFSMYDFRYTIPLIPPAIVPDTGGTFRFRIRNGPGDTTTFWGGYIDTTALKDGPPPGSPGHPDHSTHCNMGQPSPPIIPADDVETSFGPPAILDLEGNIILPGVMSLNHMSFSSLASWVGTIPAVCTYEVEVFTVEEDLILVASGTTLQNAFTDLEFDVDPLLNVTLVRVTLHQERAGTGQPQIRLSLYDISVFEATCTTPSAPIDLVVTSHRDDTNPSAAIVDMTWGAPITGDPPFEYFVYRVREGTEAIDILVHVTTDLFSSVSTLSLDQNHCFYIVASNDCGEGPPSLIQCTSVSSIVLGPTNFRGASVCEGEMLSLFWDLPSDVGGIGGFHIYRDGVLVANLGNTVNTWVDLEPGLEVLHTYELRTLDLSGAEIGDMTLILENVFACEWMDCTTENEAVEGEWTQILV